MKAIVLLLLLCCCSPPAAELSVVNGPELDSYDPQLATSAASGRLLSAVFDGLTTFDPVNGKLSPQLANKWTSSDQNRRWNFELRTDAKWSDGSPLNANDVVQSWQRLQSPATAAPYKNWLDGATIKTLSPHSLEVVFPTPQPLFPTLCSYHALAPIPVELRRSPSGTIPESMRYSGPYSIDTHRTRDFTRLVSNKFHYDYDPAAFSPIDFLCVDSSWTAMNLFLNGQVDFVPQVPQLAIKQLNLDMPNSVQASPSFTTYFIRLQQQQGSPFTNLQLRRALSLAIDRQRLCDLLGGERLPAAALVPPGIKDYNQYLLANNYSPAEARSSLDLARQELGQDFTGFDYLYPASKTNSSIAEYLQQQWAEVLGLEISLNQIEAKSFFAQQSQGNYQASHSTWIGDYFHPFTFLELFASDSNNNRCSFSNKNYDSLLDASQVSLDPDKCLSILSDAEKLLLTQYAIIPLFFDSNLQLLRDDIRGFSANRFGIIEWQQLRKKH